MCITVHGARVRLRGFTEKQRGRCYQLSQALDNSNKQIMDLSQQLTMVKQDNTRLKSENASLQSIVVNDKFPSGSKNLKEYTMILQQKVEEQMLQQKEYDVQFAVYRQLLQDNSLGGKVSAIDSKLSDITKIYQEREEKAKKVEEMVKSIARLRF